ncbi:MULTISPECIES: glucose-6-phosphate dehydrogenase [unclassified Mycolicibacterium]|uniref:glucose-6-phosphate dehydrogenase n=1 Tax=unclassified Mycolicibacterium TaxID=2636767 RepID=UPI0012DF1FC7|nr:MULTISPECIES: glucose-6-phosphate dehydrogenase [unclassified Mycolicibacterium]MUL85702.1 glucose-6-phosphate dehydrogenase [Mycolicibacterium sp. CBMA 329]MUL91579.1 glucose-6-phosphate dehydrogenase [Mycolicibacterium sp. CBMA 331]MUM02181.1 glucose-6-phosphate dehydrogenase [Mycolicibacterium sp. CBMA 334]MUM28013.1 glucose-6-phosphate dehydrogenase [Mycolicibacterium sp. CBMA 295]MUM41131.1 glucose-6-phosphate dehydrogenase [Mycolicibacterium sp. CBMA 247]
MAQQRDDFFGDVFARYFRPAIDQYPSTAGTLVHRLIACTDDVQDRLAQARLAAAVWGEEELGHFGPVHPSSELFVFTQCGLMYGARFADAHHGFYYLATPHTMFDALVDQIEHTPLRLGTVVAVDRRCSHDLASAHPMDAALRRILDEHEALRVDVRA